MPEKLKPFSVLYGHERIEACPECGATGDYALLKACAEAVINEWSKADGHPGTQGERENIGNAIARLEAAINMEPDPR